MIQFFNSNLGSPSLPWARQVEQALQQLTDQQARGQSQGNNSTSANAANLALMGQKLGNLQSIVDNLSISASQVTAGTFGAGVILPSGNISGNIGNTVVGAVNSGSIYSPNPLVSPGSHNYNVSVNYVACWINGDGTFGTSPSSGAVKVDLIAFTTDDAKKVLNVTPYWGHYVWDDPDSPMKSFVLAEDVQAAGFGPDVAPVVVGDEPQNIGTGEVPVLIQPGKAWTVNYSQLVVPLLAALRAQEDEIVALKASVAELTTRVTALDGGK